MQAHMRLAEYYPLARNDVMMDLDMYQEFSKKPGNVWGVPTGYGWGILPSYLEIASAVIQYEKLFGDRKYCAIGSNIADYLFGLNNWGTAFVALKDYPSIKNPYSPIYLLQRLDRYPEGAVALGPATARDHKENMRWGAIRYPMRADISVQYTRL